MKDDKLSREDGVYEGVKSIAPLQQTKELPEKEPAETKITARQILWLAAVIFLFVLSVAGTVIMWGTTLIDDIINENLVIKNNSNNFHLWLKPPITPTLKVWVFNYTNLEEFEKGFAKKLRVKETGPYAFREVSERVNVVFNDNGTVTYYDKKLYYFLPEMSNGSLDDKVFVINVPLMAMNYQARGLEYLKWLAATASLKVINPQPILMRTVGEFLTGYKDTLTAIAGLKIKDIRVGLLEANNGTMTSRITMYTGVDDISLLGRISRFNGMDSFSYYSGRCARLDASDGTRFPPSSVRPDKNLTVFHPDVCRTVPLVFREHVKVWDDIPALRYYTPDNLFDNGEDYPDNACYCTKEYRDDFCLPSGVMGTSHCSLGSPTYVSYPHFYHGDPSLSDAVEGLSPDPEKHTMYIDIHQRLGSPVAARQRLQMSILMKNTFHNSLIAKVHNNLLPTVWLERDCGEFVPEVRQIFHLVSFTLPMVETTLMYGCPIVAAITGLVLLVCIYVEVAAVLRKDDPDMEITHL